MMKSAKIPLSFWSAFAPLIAFVLLALLAPVLANNKPIVVIDSGTVYFPIFTESLDHKYSATPTDYSFAIHPPVPFLPSDVDLDHSGQAPFVLNPSNPWFFNHWLGTDELGRDVLAQLIYGCRSSMSIAVGAMAVALILGLLVGTLGGFWQGRFLSISLWKILLFVPLFGYSIYSLLIFGIQHTVAGSAFLALFLLILLLVWRQFARTRQQKTPQATRFQVSVSPDRWAVALINFFTTIPGYFALLAFLALWPQPTRLNIAVILGLLMWPTLARLTRASIISVRSSGFVESAQSLGFSSVRVTLRHMLPNAIQPTLVALSFGVGGAIVAESFLSFVGIAPAEMTSWGTLLAKVRAYPNMWWLSVFPGLSILAAILSFYRLANYLRRIY